MVGEVSVGLGPAVRGWGTSSVSTQLWPGTQAHAVRLWGQGQGSEQGPEEHQEYV